MSENGADVSWDDVGKVLEEEMSSTGKKYQYIQSIGNDRIRDSDYSELDELHKSIPAFF